MSQLQVDPQENRRLVLKLMEFLDLLAQKDNELKRREDYLLYLSMLSRRDSKRREKLWKKTVCIEPCVEKVEKER